MSTRRQRAEAARERVRRWKPLEKAVLRRPPPERVAAMRAAALERGADPDEAERMMFDHGELRMNDIYTVAITRHEEGWIELLSIKRNDRQPDIPWRHLQRMKTEIAGSDVEAIEIFPAESRLVDTANQRWLWCFPPGFIVPRGFNNGRVVAGPEEAAKVGAVQAPFDEEEVPVANQP